MKSIGWLLMAALFCQNTFAAMSCDSSYKLLSKSELAQLLTPLERGVLVRSDFEQSRVMRLLKKPLRSNGNMIFAPGLGLHWQINEPFNYRLIMTAEQFIQVNGEQKQVINAADQPAMFAISRIFADLFAGDFLAAENYFAIQGRAAVPGKTAQWFLCLVPVREPFTKLMAYIEISGGKKIDAVYIQDVSNDYTQIKFFNLPSNSLSNNSALTDAEKLYFQKY